MALDPKITSIFVDQIIALSTEAALYGAYLVSLLHTLRWLLFSDEGWKLRHKASWLMATLTLVLFALSTLHFVADIRITASFIGIDLGSSENLAGFIWGDVMTVAIETITIIIVDAVLIYRCWAVYGKWFLVILFPSILWLGDIACMIMGIYFQVVQDVKATTDDVRFKKLPVKPVQIAFYASTTAVNIYCATMIIHRIWTVSNNSNGPKRHLQLIMRIIIESGLLYTLTTISLLISLVVTNNALALPLTCYANLQITTIAYNLILIRVARSKSDKNIFESQKITKLSTMRFNHVATMNELDIAVHTEKEQDTESGSYHDSTTAKGTQPSSGEGSFKSV